MQTKLVFSVYDYLATALRQNGTICIIDTQICEKYNIQKLNIHTFGNTLLGSSLAD